MLTSRETVQRTVTIANGASVSSAPASAGQSAEPLSGYALGTFTMPAAWTAADITYQVATFSGGVLTWANLYGSTGTLVRNTNVAAGKTFEIPAIALMHRGFRLRSTNTASEADVNQGAARTIIVTLKS